MLKIGIFQCDHVHETLVTIYGEYTDMIEKAFANYIESEQMQSLQFIRYAVIDNEFPDDDKECDAYIITGSKHNVDDSLPWLDSLKQRLKNLYKKNIPVVGICFGHQLIASALGGRVIQSDKGWGVGVYESLLQHKELWMEGFKDRLKLIYSHQDQIVKPPAETKTLYSSEFCPYGMILVGNKFLGIQGHPEFQKPYSEGLMQHRKEKIPDDTRQKGLKSLSQNVDSKQVINGIFKFIKQKAKNNNQN